MAAELLAIAEDFRRLGVFLCRDVAGFLKQRQVDIAFNVASRARIAVPIPGAAEITCPIDDAEILDALLPQARTGEKPAEAAADDCDLCFFDDRRARKAWFDIRVGVEVAENGVGIKILVRTIGPQALVAFDAVFFS